MPDAEIAAKARFDIIRYAQVWEDAEVLLAALRGPKGRAFLSVCSAGDNALALLLLDPSRIAVRDLSAAQLHCLHARVAAMTVLSWPEFMALMQPPPAVLPSPAHRHRQLMDRVLGALDSDSQAFWHDRIAAVEKLGLAGAGRFEHYFSVFRRYVLPLIHRRQTVEGVFVPRPPAERAAYHDGNWDNWRWRLATKLFFSRFIMGRLGRDPSFFAHAEGSLSDQVRRKARFAAVDIDPCANPYMQWILLGRHTLALPLAWRQEHYQTIRSRCDRLEIGLGPVDEAPGRFDGFNLSDVFEYMADDEFAAAYGRLLTMAAPAARLVYWNMMAPRRAPAMFAAAVRRDLEAEKRLGAADKAFFYADLVIEEVS